MKITSIEETKKGRLSLFVDGAFAFSVHKDTFLQTELARDAELSPERLLEIKEQDAYISAREKAFSLLDRKEYTEKLLKDRLMEFCEEEPAAAAVERMRELGLVNDADYGRRYAADLFHLRHYPRRRVEQELYRRGIAKDLIEEILADYSEEEETATAAGVLLKKYKNQLSCKKDIDKTIAAMLRRGFAMENIRGALEVVMETLRQEEPEESEEWDFE